MVLDTSLLNTQHYKIRIKGKVEQSKKMSSGLELIGVAAIEKGACCWMERILFILVESKWFSEKPKHKIIDSYNSSNLRSSYEKIPDTLICRFLQCI